MWCKSPPNNRRGGPNKSLQYKFSTHCNSTAIFHRHLFQGKEFAHKYTNDITDLDTPSVSLERGVKWKLILISGYENGFSTSSGWSILVTRVQTLHTHSPISLIHRQKKGRVVWEGKFRMRKIFWTCCVASLLGKVCQEVKRSLCLGKSQPP